jgi:hypothetical protein
MCEEKLNFPNRFADRNPAEKSKCDLLQHASELILALSENCGNMAHVSCYIMSHYHSES